MADRDIQEQLTKYLTDVHSIEEQALVQMRRAPEIAGDPDLEAAFRTHLAETEQHEQLIKGCLSAHGASPSKIKDAAGAATGIAFALFAKVQPDTPGKLAAHAYSYEHMEEAAYNLLADVAQRAGDEQTLRVAKEIRDQERAMALRLEGLFDSAVQASLRELSPDDLSEQLCKYLADAHAIEGQATELLKRGPHIVDVPELRRAFEEHLEQTRTHQQLIVDALEARDASPNRLKDAALRLGALNWGLFFGAQPDTPAKLAGFAYAFEHLEIASYEQLRRVALQAGDSDAASIAERILSEERHAADQLHSLFGVAMSASLHTQVAA